MRDYGSPSYWDERYAVEDGSNFDWYCDFGTLKAYLMPYIMFDAENEILIAGCGNSRLGADLYDVGFHNLTCIDRSAVVISQMGDRYADKEEMEFSVMDARAMELPDACFDVIIDKALFDSQLCSENNLNDAAVMVSEMDRVLKPGGVYIVISHGMPATRLAYLQKKGVNWDVETKEIEKFPIDGYEEQGPSASHHMYICTKHEDDDMGME